MSKKLNLTWPQFNELHALMEAIKHSKAVGADNGNLKNTIMDAKWETDAVEIKLDLPE